MKHVDSCLQRLFRAASGEVEEDLPIEAPFLFEARVLSAWRSAPTTTERFWLSVPVLRRAFVCACGVMLLSAFYFAHSWSDGATSELVNVDSAIRLAWTQ